MERKRAKRVEGQIGYMVEVEGRIGYLVEVGRRGREDKGEG